MFFKIQNKYNLPIDALKTRVIFEARRRILVFYEGTNEVYINKILKEKFNTSLKIICFKILNNCKVMQNFHKEVVVIIPDKNLNNMASLITYGPDGKTGSQILQTAFNQE